jgi:hypothetical protein
VTEAVSYGKKVRVTILGLISVSQRNAWLAADVVVAQDVAKFAKKLFEA